MKKAKGRRIIIAKPYEITLCSPEAKRYTGRRTIKDIEWGKTVYNFNPKVTFNNPYPFDKLKIGHSFRVKYDPIVHKQLARMAHNAKSRLRRKFKVIFHKDIEYVEVARIM